MSHRCIALLLVLAIIPLCVHADKTVEATGMGASKEQARNDALRMAVEQGVGTKIFSETVVQDFVAIKDVVFSQSFGLVTSYEILSAQKKDEMWEVRVRANVSADASANWAKMRSILEQNGNPKVMLCLRETLDKQDTAQSMGEGKILEKFKALGFQMIDRQYFEQTKELQKQIASLNGDHNAVVAAAADLGADLVVVGLLEGSYKGTSNMYGMQYIEHNYIFGAKIIRTDTAQIVGSMNKAFLKGYPSIQGGREHLGRIGFGWAAEYSFIEPLVVDMVKTWIDEGQNTGRPLTVSISNAPFKLRNQIKSALEEGMADSIVSVDVDQYRNRILKLRVMSRISCEDLAGVLDGFAVGGGQLTVDSLTENSVSLIFEN